MTGFELLYSCVRPFEHPLYQHISRKIRAFMANQKYPIILLDVGGRRSNYTIGLEADVWVSDVPREHEIQKKLDLGATDEIQKLVLHRRSNVKKYIYDDMTATALPESHFGIISAIEVLEHVENDEVFLNNVRRLLSPDGIFVMSTPNGDYIPIPYSDHKRHYRMCDLKTLLNNYFRDVEVEYRVNSGKLFKLGCHPWSVKTPIRTIVSMGAFFMSDLLESKIMTSGRGLDGKLHIVAVCRA